MLIIGIVLIFSHLEQSKSILNWRNVARNEAELNKLTKPIEMIFWIHFLKLLFRWAHRWRELFTGNRTTHKRSNKHALPNWQSVPLLNSKKQLILTGLTGWRHEIREQLKQREFAYRKKNQHIVRAQNARSRLWPNESSLASLSLSLSVQIVLSTDMRTLASSYTFWWLYVSVCVCVRQE